MDLLSGLRYTMKYLLLVTLMVAVNSQTVATWLEHAGIATGKLSTNPGTKTLISGSTVATGSYNVSVDSFMGSKTYYYNISFPKTLVGTTKVILGTMQLI